MTQDDGQQFNSMYKDRTEDSDSNTKVSRHSNPTPSPNDRNISQCNVAKKNGNDSKYMKSDKSKDALNAPKKSLSSLYVDAIIILDSRSGSTVQAIVKQIKSTGYEINDERRFGKIVLRSLKMSVVKCDLVQVKRVFKVSPENKRNCKAVEKMRAKRLKLKEKQELKRAKIIAEEQEKSANAQSESKAIEPRKKNTDVNLAAIACEAKTAAVAKAQAKLDAEPKIKAKKSQSAAKAIKAKPKAKTVRKFIATLAQVKIKPKPTAQSIKRVVAAKQLLENTVDSDSKISNTSPILSLTAIKTPRRQTRKARKNLP